MEDLDLEDLAKSTTTKQTEAALDEVRRKRAIDDEAHGYFRDYPDSDTPSRALWSRQQHEEAIARSRAPSSPWLAQLAVRFGAIFGVLSLATTLPVEERDRRLRPLLLDLAALVVAWAEAVDARPRPAVVRLPWWRRLLVRLRVALRRGKGGRK